MHLQAGLKGLIYLAMVSVMLGGLLALTTYFVLDDPPIRGAQP